MPERLRGPGAAYRYTRYGGEPLSGRIPTWSPTPLPLAVELPEPGEIDLWFARIPSRVEEAEQLLENLSAEERNRADRFQVERPRWQFIYSHAALRRLLGAYLRIDPAAVGYQTDPGGKPRLEAKGYEARLRFNLSHGGDALLIGICRDAEIGVDVETCRHRTCWLQIAERNFHPDEVALLKAAPADEAVRLFHRCWTLKEAFIKALGEGLRFPLRDVNVHPVLTGETLGWLDAADRRWRCEEALTLGAWAAAAVWEVPDRAPGGNAL